MTTYKLNPLHIPLKSLALALVISLLLVSAVMAAGGDLDPDFFSLAINTGDDVDPSPITKAGVGLQSTGKIILAGKGFCSPACDIVVIRKDESGVYDNEFSDDGIQLIDLGGDESFSKLAVQTDDKVLLLGTTCMSGDCQLFLLRLTANGELDPSFSNDGVYILSAKAGGASYGLSMEIRSNGKIVVLGELLNLRLDLLDPIVLQFRSNGSLDNKFGTRGWITLRTIEASSDLSIQPDGKIVVAGVGGVDPSNDGFAVVRLNADGRRLDGYFGLKGSSQVVDIGAFDIAKGVALMPDGSIVVAGSTFSLGEMKFILLRYTPQGFLDTTFNSTGIVDTDITLGRDDGAFDVAVQSDGKIIAVGYTNVVGSNEDIAVVRYNSNGSLDASFSADGIVTIGYYTNDFASNIVIQPDGKYLVAGSSEQITIDDIVFLTLDRILP